MTDCHLGFCVVSTEKLQNEFNPHDSNKKFNEFLFYLLSEEDNLHQ